MTKTNGAPGYTPSPAEIAYGCRKLHRSWTESEERARRTGTAVEQPYKLTPTPGSVFALPANADTRVI